MDCVCKNASIYVKQQSDTFILYFSKQINQIMKWYSLKNSL